MRTMEKTNTFCNHCACQCAPVQPEQSVYCRFCHILWQSLGAPGTKIGTGPLQDNDGLEIKYTDIYTLSLNLFLIFRMNDPDAYQNHFIVIMGHSGHSFDINFFGRILQITNSQYMEEYEIMPREIPKGKKKILKNNNKIQLLLRKFPWDQ